MAVLYDHVSPPEAIKAYRHDVNEDFRFDLLGVRVATVLVSPWIGEATIFHSTQPGRHYDATSFIATMLKWLGIPATNWWLVVVSGRQQPLNRSSRSGQSARTYRITYLHPSLIPNSLICPCMI